MPKTLAGSELVPSVDQSNQAPRLRDACEWRGCAMPAGLIDARRLLGWRLGRSAMPACCAGARRLPDSLMRDARSRAVAAVTASVAPFGCVRMRAGGPGPVRGSSRSGQQDQASDDRRVQATEAGEQPRFESNRGCQSPRPRRSRLMVKDVRRADGLLSRRFLCVRQR